MAKDAGGVVFERVTKRYGEVTAVDDVSFRVAPGELVTLLGPSGCGKTTTLRMVAGLEPVSSGRIADRRHRRDAARGERARRQHGVPVVRAVPAHDGAGERLLRPAVDAHRTRRRRASSRTRSSRCWASPASSERLPSELSGGQQQRVAVARSLVLEPAVLLFDEPLSNLDAKLRRRVRQEIRELQQSLALTVIYVTHDQEEALAVSDHIIVMDSGRIAQQGTPHELYEAPASRFLADFIGDANLVDGELDGGRGRRDVHRRRRRRARARGRHRAGPRHARGAAAPAAPRRRRGRACCRACASAPPTSAAGSSTWWRRPWGELLVFDDEAREPRGRDEPVGVAFDPDAAIVLPR